jgi:hypothetical protein
MEPTPELIAQLRREAIADARKQSFEQKFLAGAELFDYACEITKAGIRAENPDFSEEQVLDELRRRLELRSRRENAA